ncbi:MAG: ANTAR domain-containing protein [Clostridia bacterium]|nr:ANTAR domain-containing protein [Clostridia bacterium]
MPVEKRRYSVLVVSGKEQSAKFLSAMLLSFEYRQVDTVTGASEAKRKLLQTRYDIIIIDSPLPDELGCDFAADIAYESRAGIMLMVKGEIYERICAKVEDYGVLTVPKPITRQDFYTAVKLVTSTAARLLNDEKKIIKLQDKLEEIKLVNRAKFILMEKHRMTEQEAHRFIEKDAMDSRRSKAQVAKEIIDKE